MTSMKLLLVTSAVALLPAAVSAGPGAHGGGMGRGASVSAMGPGAAMGRGMSAGHGSTRVTAPRATTTRSSATTRAPTTRVETTDQAVAHSSMGSTRGAGWDHMNGPASTGQPGVECEEVTPGHASTAPGSAFNEEGTAHQHYAGEQPQNSRNTASVSQYDVACVNQPQH